jgi:hydrogenase 3 maturation protease
MDEFISRQISPQGKTVIVCIGNDLRADDGVGPYIASFLKIKSKDIKIINAFSVIENYIDEIIKFSPNKLIIIDAAFFDGEVGEIRILDENKLSNYKIVSTHSFPLDSILKIIREDLPKLEITILAIQPQDIGYKEALSGKVKAAADEIIEFYNSLGR